MKSPFPYFGGKSKVAADVWKRFGSVKNYVEPFFGSGAMLLNRPLPFVGTETINDADGLLSNFWRAIKCDSARVAAYAEWPISENDLHARHAWLVSKKESLQGRLEGDPDYYDVKIAGWWVWGMCCWIGSGFCAGRGPWRVSDVDGAAQLVRGERGGGITSQLIHLGSAGMGIHRKRVVLPFSANRGVISHENLDDYFSKLSDRLKDVRVCCGDWSRIIGPSVTFKRGLTAVLLDPPYADTASRAEGLYRIDSDQTAHAVREWAIEQGANSLMRIALCGYEGEHEMPPSWECFYWKQNEGFGSQSKDRSHNNRRERIWFSPHCLKAEQGALL